jgi:hypothetical protein
MFAGVGLSIIMISLVFVCLFPKVKQALEDNDNDDF